jgi:hypothetical protein
MRDERAISRRRGIAPGLWVAAVALAAGVTLAACVDETHAEQVAALGGEAGGVSPGPLHRPGQPCLVCHGEAGPSSHTFVIAGTVYATQGQDAPAAGVQVELEDSTASSVSLSTNEAGNFYIPTGEWSPTFPMLVPQIMQGQTTQAMQTHIARAGSCADCHTLNPGPTSPGRVFLNRASSSGPSLEGGP